jgi:hypothetical protein
MGGKRCVIETRPHPDGKTNSVFHSALAAIKGDLLAKPNYQFEKRQRDLAKKRKQEEKRLQKLADKAAAGGSSGDVAADPSQAAPPDTDNAAGATPPEAS